jgi:predicted RNase H-related nuclease YkuK (DUF458 family)
MLHVSYRTVDGKRVNPITHTIEIMKKDPYVEIHVGTDSQNHGDKTQYATVVAYRYGNRGVHYIYSLDTKDRIRDMWTRLWGETERSVAIAEHLSTNIPGVKIKIDMDFNSDEEFDSNKLVSASRGWALSLGYIVNIKPNDQIATRAADHQCR